MTGREKELLVVHERTAYNQMQKVAKRLGRQNEVFQIARAKWFTLYDLCLEFGIIPVEGEDNDK